MKSHRTANHFNTFWGEEQGSHMLVKWLLLRSPVTFRSLIPWTVFADFIYVISQLHSTLLTIPFFLRDSLTSVTLLLLLAVPSVFLLSVLYKCILF